MKPSRRQWDREWEKVLHLRKIARVLNLDLREIEKWKPEIEGMASNQNRK